MTEQIVVMDVLVERTEVQQKYDKENGECTHRCRLLDPLIPCTRNFMYVFFSQGGSICAVTKNLQIW